MGKYMRKAKATTASVAIVDSPLGVRTRAQALALQQQQPAAAAAAAAASCYLQLRSRRLEKPGAAPSAAQPPQAAGCSSVGSVSRQSWSVSPVVEVEVEVSFGENFLGVGDRERNSRETTPCSLIRNSESMSTPGSTTRPNSSTISLRRQNSACRNIPTAREMEEFFAQAEQIQQRIFAEKYNFDIVNERPLAGRYEWVKLGC